VQEKTKEIARTYGIKVDEFSCSSGWLWLFQKRHNIVSHVMCGEAAKVNEPSVNDWLRTFQPIRERYSLQNTFNMDESGIFFNLLPERSLDLKGNKCHGHLGNGYYDSIER
jgi:hypothetical protein